MSECTAEQARSSLFELILNNAFFKEKIILSSGKESDYYIDARRVTLSARGAYYCGHVLFGMIQNETIDAVGGPTLGADPMVGAVAYRSVVCGQPTDTFIIRKAAKAHGRQQQVEGPRLKEGARVILIDDVATTGKAFLESLDVTDSMKIKVVKALCIVDRQEGAAEALAARGCPLESVFTAEEFLKQS